MQIANIYIVDHFLAINDELERRRCIAFMHCKEMSPESRHISMVIKCALRSTFVYLYCRDDDDDVCIFANKSWYIRVYIQNFYMKENNMYRCPLLEWVQTRPEKWMQMITCICMLHRIQGQDVIKAFEHFESQFEQLNHLGGWWCGCFEA